MRSVVPLLLALAVLLATPPVMAQTRKAAAAPPSSALSKIPIPPPLPWPEGAGLCQCGYLGGTAKTTDQPYTKDELALHCMSAVEECKSACGSSTDFRFVPHAGFSCPLAPGQTVGPVAMAAPRSLRLGSR